MALRRFQDSEREPVPRADESRISSTLAGAEPSTGQRSRRPAPRAATYHTSNCIFQPVPCS